MLAGISCRGDVDGRYFDISWLCCCALQRAQEGARTWNYRDTLLLVLGGAEPQDCAGKQ